MLDASIGQVILFAGNFPPKDWAFCDGSLMSIAQNTALFAILGTTYGGDGKTNFALPDLRGLTVLHPSPSLNLGQKGGSATKQLTTANVPPHTHAVTTAIKANTAGGNTTNPVGAYLANTSKPDPEFSSAASNSTMAADTITGVTVSTEGSGQPFSNMQPYLAVNFIICLRGAFPQRS